MYLKLNKDMLKDFIRYFGVGIINTIVHWVIFAIIFYFIYSSQAVANLIGFLTAVTTSFFLNAKFTFKTSPTMLRYLLFVLFMGGLSFIVGCVAQKMAIHPLITMMFFSAVSLILGFLYSKFVVFSHKTKFSK